jgi:diguanylate cyclase (GGDEF)-like protein
VTATAVGQMQRLNGREAVWLNQELLHDALTGLPNCMLFHNRTEHALQPRRRHHQQVAVPLLDMDRFTAIIDSLGHMSGTA